MIKGVWKITCKRWNMERGLVSEVRGSFTDEEWSRVHFVGQLP